MRNIILLALSIGSLHSCQSKDEKINKVTTQSIAPMGTNTVKPSFTCKLTTPELQKRKATVIKEIKDIIRHKEELNNGYAYKFDGSDHTIDLLSEFIKTERQCCDFFNFNISVNNENTIVLNITGTEGIKDFIAAELDM